MHSAEGSGNSHFLFYSKDYNYKNQHADLMLKYINAVILF